jgi:hypothetical protein
LQAFIRDHAEETECDFCGAVSEEPIAAPFDDVMEHINSCIGGHYDDPANAGLPYETAEGGYQGETFTTEELFDEVGLDFPKDKNDQLRNAVALGLSNDLWCEAEPFRLNRDQQLKFSWDHFCEVTKHKLRYFFSEDDRDDEEIYPPTQILKLIFSYAETAGAFVTMPKGTHLHRARRQTKEPQFNSAGALGPPPVEFATQTNRMSPPGIVMTYVADDPETALAETANKVSTYALGEFVTERDALILDLTRIPAAPTMFAELPDTMEYDPRPRLAFLHRISREISRPIARDDRLHIEYVPTQVITEFVRKSVTVKKRRIEGIRYRSSRRKGKTALVLFADRTNLVLDKDEQPQFYHLYKDRWLRLHKATKKWVSKKDIARWAKGDDAWWHG